MALLRSEIVVACRDANSASLDELAQQLNPVCGAADLWLSSQRNPNGRLALQLPLDQYSDGEVDSINGDTVVDGRVKKSTKLEESPTDSAFHSDDFSPEGSRSEEPIDLFSRLVDCCTPNPDSASDPDNDFLRYNDVSDCLSKEETHHSKDQENQWEYDNWLWGPNIRNVHVNRVPMVIPVPSVPMKPRLGYRDMDAMSDLSDGCSIVSSESSLICHSENMALHELAFLMELTDCTVGVGKVARFSCQLMGRSALAVSWFHGKKSVDNTGRYRTYRQGTKHTLEIYFTSFADSATVRCVAYTEDVVTESRAQLRVRESRLHPRSPEFVFCLEPLEIIRGDDAELSCRVRGHPVPILTFFVDGRKISPMDSGFEIEHIGNEEWLLLIDGSRLLSSCNIRCLATNPLGETTCSASVIVLSSNELANNRLSVDGRLKNLDRKLAHTKEQILNNAEEMLNNATQMSSLERQLAIVDEYLDRIESKFRKSKFTRVDSNPRAAPVGSPAHLSVIEVSYPDTSPQQHTPQRTSYPCPSECRTDDNPPNRHSVSITVLSRQINSEKINVVFKKSFGQSDSENSYQPETISFDTYCPKPPSPPTTDVECRESVASREKTKWTKAIVMDENNNPYSGVNLSRRLDNRSRTLDAVLANGLRDFSEEDPGVATNEYLGKGAYYNGNITYATANESSRSVLTGRSGNALVPPSSVIDEKVNRTADRLQQLDSRIDILSRELKEVQQCTPSDLKRLESAVILTASEIHATERSTKQVESLVTRLYVQQDFIPQRPLVSPDSRKPTSLPASGISLPVVQQSTVVTYANMTSTPQDFPQDGPSVKSLMSRFQNDKPKPSENGQPRRLSGAFSEESSDSAITPSPDKDRKPLPVFNKAKFQENVAANRALPRPKIHASLTARSLSREMREQLRISRPQIGAFRSNIMTSEHGEYDPERAAKAKELFLAEGGTPNGNNRTADVQNESGVSYEKVVRPNRFRQDPFMEAHEEQYETVQENHDEFKNSVNEDSGIHEVESMPLKHNGHYHVAEEERVIRSDDSLDEETEHHDSTSDQHERSSAHENELSEDEPEMPENHHHNGEQLTNGNDHPATEEESSGHVEHTDADQKTSPEENGEDIPLSQAPDWDLLI
ncbi:uncharacterized protein LOC129583666 [Paramacrobiotus metropolitanus]|uniref:uncharacterized protein LOC129583666 n=1 Tax=Paramacrobiotus metropolitanus TaxID=2943436 RepID=UPI00244625BC|nr:uncharacterized protein LOC129583666 [Paramacrobiotus metropolitanus]XP_055331536.1 uncharacterized protein LOC129583666 [Paramacrobiotus metropolitanus]